MSVTAPQITAVVLTRNEARHLADCLAALRFCGRRLAVDCGSTDGTQTIAAAAGAELVHRDFDDFSSQRNFALSKIETEWALMIDADERVSAALAAELSRAAAAPGDAAAFAFPRDNHYLGAPLRFAGTGRDRVVRLLRVGKTRYENLVHEAVKCDGPVRELAGPLIHLTVVSLADSLRKVVQYSELSALELRRRGRTIGPAGILGRTLARFVKIYCLRFGVLDGARGLIAAGFEAAGVFFKYALLWEARRAARDSSGGR